MLSVKNKSRAGKGQKAVGQMGPVHDVTALTTALVVGGVHTGDLRAYVQKWAASGVQAVEAGTSLFGCPNAHLVRFHCHRDARAFTSQHTHTVDGRYCRLPLWVCLYDEQSGSVYSGHDSLHLEQEEGRQQTVDIPRVDPEAPTVVLVTGVVYPWVITADSIKHQLETLGKGKHTVKSVLCVEPVDMAIVVFDHADGARAVADVGTCELNGRGPLSDLFRPATARLFLYRGTLMQNSGISPPAGTPGVQKVTTAPSAVNHQSVENMETSDTHAQQGASLPVVMEGVRGQVGSGLEAGLQSELADGVDSERTRVERLVRELEELRQQMNAERENMEISLRQEMVRELDAKTEEMKRAFREELKVERDRMERQLRAEREEMQRERERMQMEAQSGFSQIQGQITQLEMQAAGTQTQVKEINDQLGSQTSQQKRDIQQTTSDLRAETQRLERDVTQLRQHVTELEGSLRGEMGEVRSDLRSEAMDLENQMTQTVTQLKQRVTELRQRVTQLQTSLDMQGRMHMGLVVEVGRQTRDEVAGLTNSIQTFSVEIQSVQTQLSHLARAALGGQHLFVDNLSDASSQ